MKKGPSKETNFKTAQNKMQPKNSSSASVRVRSVGAVSDYNNTRLHKNKLLKRSPRPADFKDDGDEMMPVEGNEI